MARRYPPITEAEILRLRDHCLEREAKGNKAGGSFTDNVDLRRGIIFYHSDAGEWYLRRDWRRAFNERYPAYALDENGPLTPRKIYPSRRTIDGLVHHLQWYDRSICWITRSDGKWRLVRTSHEDGYSGRRLVFPNTTYISDEWKNSIEAFDDLWELYELFNHSCPLCGCDWRETKRYKDEGNHWHCGCCHATGENTEITGSEPALAKPVNPSMEPMIGGKGK